MQSQTSLAPQVGAPKKKLFLFELNEFNLELLRDASATLGFRNLARLLELPETTARTNDTYESDYLEPWVQWVSVHTGTSSQEHRIKHLGDIGDLSYPQVWESLSDAGITSGIFGVLNGCKGRAANCLFFLPDPWTFSEPAYPRQLNGLLELPRYLAKNYLSFSNLRLFAGMVKLFSVFLKPAFVWEMVCESPRVLWTALRYRGVFAFFCFVEYLQGLLFLRYRDRYQPEFSVLFVNSLAHLQHYYWQGKDYRANPRLAYGLRYIDRLVGAIYRGLAEGERLVVLNGLSQMNTNHEPAWISYRLIDHAEFLSRAGIHAARIEPLMSYDTLLFFDTEAECRYTHSILAGARIADQALFLVEAYATNPRKLFFRASFTDPATADLNFEINGRTLKFSDFMRAIVRRTGRHVQKSTILSDLPGLPPVMMNHDLPGFILQYFGVSQTIQAAQAESPNHADLHGVTR